MAKLVTAFLGVAHIHTPNFVNRLKDRADSIQIKAVYDVDQQRATATAQHFEDAQVAVSPEVIINDPEINSVVICSETAFHKGLVIAAANAGKNIFCEKPLGLTASDATAMAEAINNAGVMFQTGFFMRGNGIHRFIKQELEAGHLGKITRVRYTNCHQAALDGWFDTDWRWLANPSLAGGGAMLDLGAHVLDIVLHTYIPTEGEITNISAVLGNKNGRYGSLIDEYGSALLTFESGAIAEIEASWVDPKLRAPIEVNGTEGQIHVIDGELRYYSKHIPEADGKVYKELPPNTTAGFDAFWEALLGKSLDVPLVSVDEAAQGSMLMERIYTSAGRVIRN